MTIKSFESREERALGLFLKLADSPDVRPETDQTTVSRSRSMAEILADPDLDITPIGRRTDMDLKSYGNFGFMVIATSFEGTYYSRFVDKINPEL